MGQAGKRARHRHLGAGVSRGGGARGPAGASLRRRAGVAARSRRHHGGGARRRLYTNLITSGVGVTDQRLRQLADAGLDHVQISIQDSEPKSADLIAGYEGAYVRKRALASTWWPSSCR